MMQKQACLGVLTLRQNIIGAGRTVRTEFATRIEQSAWLKFGAVSATAFVVGA